MQNKVIFILILALVVVCVLFWRSCQSTPDASLKRDKEAGSIAKKQLADSIKFSKFSDSLQTENVKLKIRNDSLIATINETKSNLHQKGNSIQELLERYYGLKGGNTIDHTMDTINSLHVCDSLVIEVTGAKALVFLYENQSDSLQKVLGHLIQNKDTLINRLSGLYQEANNQVFQFSRLYNLQSADLKKAQKNANKRFSIGPVFGGGIADNKIVPFVGIGLTYSLIKF